MRTRLILYISTMLLLGPSFATGDSLPRIIGSLHLKQSKFGEAARQEINRLHGKKLNFRKGLIGTYWNGSNTAKLWISEYDSQEEAAVEIGKMVRKMTLSDQKDFWRFRQICLRVTN